MTLANIDPDLIKVHERFFLNKLVSHLDVCLTCPEEEIISEGEIGDHMFFISKGDCVVTVRDQNNQMTMVETILTVGDHFGELALIYHCRRTATVISRCYDQFACLQYHQYRAIVNEFPHFHKLLKTFLFKYNDPLKRFRMNLLTKVKYLWQNQT
jgi:CRP-like cAMP-binding protein